MQTIMDAASHIAEEIERTRLHLANLEQALEGLKPLLTIDVSSTTLSYSQVNETQPVEDAFIVQKAKTKSKAKAASTPQVADTPEAALPEAKPAGLPATGAAFWLNAAGRKAFSSSALTEAALKTLSLDASAKAVMANRARAWITASLKKGVLVAAGMRNGVHFYKLA